MDIRDIETQITELLTKRIGIGLATIRSDAHLINDLGLDSLDTLEFAIQAERTFGITIEDRQIKSLKTVGDVIHIVQQILDANRE